MDDSKYPTGDEEGKDWELESGSSSPRSDTSSSTQSSVFSNLSTPASPADTEMSFPSLGPDDEKQSKSQATSGIISIPNHPNHVVVGSTLYSPGQLRVWRDQLAQARKTGEFPSTNSSVEDPQNIVEDYQHLRRLRDTRGDPSVFPPPEKYNLVKIDIARRIKARDEAQGSSENFQETDGRVQGWMNSISQEARMLEITQAALKRKGISNPTQDDYDAIADEFMQIAERTLLDVANPLRMNTTRLEGNVTRLDSQLNGLDTAMAAQINGLSSVNTALNASVTTQVDTLNSVMSSQLSTLNTVLASQSSTLNTMLISQSSAFNGSMSMLNTSLNTVTTDLHQLTTNLPAMIAAAVQTAVREQLTAASYQQVSLPPQRQTAESPPSYTMNVAAIPCHPIQTTPLPAYGYDMNQEIQVSTHQNHDRMQVHRTQAPKSKLRRFFGRISRRWRPSQETSGKEGILA